MEILNVVIIAAGLSMDAAAVSMTNGMLVREMKIRKAAIISGIFAVFQGLMPLTGFFGSSFLSDIIKRYNHIVALVLLLIVGGKMLIDSANGEKPGASPIHITVRLLAVQAVATSIDALAVGISFTALEVNIWRSCLIISVVTFVICFFSVYAGKKFSEILLSKTTVAGGLILIGIGIKIFIEGLFFS